MAKLPHSTGGNDEILLGVLTAVGQNSNISQRSISSELGVALGLANAYLRRAARKGFIKIKQVPRRRYAYYLTPKGFSEKARLTGQYLSASFVFFRRAREQMSELMSDCAAKGRVRIAFVGFSDLAEVGALCVQDHPVTLVGVVDAKCAGERFHGLPIHARLAECGPIDAVIITSLSASDAEISSIEAEIGPGRVLVPSLLRRAVPNRKAAQASERDVA